MNTNSYQSLIRLLPLERKLTILILVGIILLIPYMILFSHLDEVLVFYNSGLVYSFLSFSYLLGALLIFLFRPKNFSSRILFFGLLSILLVVVNLQFSLMAVPKIVLNWIGFTLIALIIAQTVVSLSDAEMYVLQVKAINFFKYLILILTLAMLVVWTFEKWYLDPALFQYYVIDNQNQMMWLLRTNIGLQKQGFGLFLFLTVAITLTHWKLFTGKTKMLILLFLFINLPFFWGIRTLLLGLMLVGLWLFFLKNSNRMAIAGILVLQIILIFFYYQDEIMMIIALLYDRLPSVQFAVSSMTEHIFGIGMGAYHIYVREHNERLLNLFGSDTMIEREVFWDAPESDIVYFIASWGILAVFFFCFLVKICFDSTKVIHWSDNIFPIEKAFLITAIGLIFMGISQDFAGKLQWCIYVPLAIGIILRHKLRRE